MEQTAMHLDYSNQGRRPTVAQILSAWRKGGRPLHFTVTYGETFAEFQREPPAGLWYASGNGQRGVERDKVERALRAECAATPRDWLRG
jgi:hypothetical protein